MKLPAKYHDLTFSERVDVRKEYIRLQDNKCIHCGESLTEPAPWDIQQLYIDWVLFPENFLKHPLHLQHDHVTGLTEGTVHNYCNAVLWQYHGR